MSFKRRGVLLVEMLTVLTIVGVGGTLMAVALASMLKSQDRVARLSNRFATTNDFINCIQADIRSGTAVQVHTLSHPDGEQTLLTITGPSGPVLYRLSEQHVERDAGSKSKSAKSWTDLAAEASVVTGPNAAEGLGVNVLVRWRRSGHDDPEPNRRFDLFVRCAGELDNGEE